MALNVPPGSPTQVPQSVVVTCSMRVAVFIATSRRVLDSTSRLLPLGVHPPRLPLLYFCSRRMRSTRSPQRRGRLRRQEPRPLATGQCSCFGAQQPRVSHRPCSTLPTCWGGQQQMRLARRRHLAGWPRCEAASTCCCWFDIVVTPVPHRQQLTVLDHPLLWMRCAQQWILLWHGVGRASGGM